MAENFGIPLQQIGAAVAYDGALGSAFEAKSIYIRESIFNGDIGVLECGCFGRCCLCANFYLE